MGHRNKTTIQSDGSTVAAPMTKKETAIHAEAVRSNNKINDDLEKLKRAANASPKPKEPTNKNPFIGTKINKTIKLEDGDAVRQVEMFKSDPAEALRQAAEARHNWYPTSYDQTRLIRFDDMVKTAELKGGFALKLEQAINNARKKPFDLSAAQLQLGHYLSTLANGIRHLIALRREAVRFGMNADDFAYFHFADQARKWVENTNSQFQEYRALCVRIARFGKNDESRDRKPRRALALLHSLDDAAGQVLGASDPGVAVESIFRDMVGPLSLLAGEFRAASDILDGVPLAPYPKWIEKKEFNKELEVFERFLANPAQIFGVRSMGRGKDRIKGTPARISAALQKLAERGLLDRNKDQYSLSDYSRKRYEMGISHPRKNDILVEKNNTTPQEALNK